MKPIAWERLLALVIALSAGRVGRAFVAPTAVVSSSRRGENKGLASSATACEDITEAKSAVGQEVLDFAIVGGGPAGLAAAVGLKEKGLAVKVFEAAPRITERGAAVFLQSFGLAKLDEIKPGLAAEAVSAGREVEVLHLTRPSGETIAKVNMTVVAEVVGYPFIGITRYALQSVLLGHLEDGDVELGARLEGLETHEAEGITELRFEGQTDTVRARAVIGADGRRSVVRKTVLAKEERNCDWALTWWALADIPEPATPKGEFRMSYNTKQAIYYGEVEEGVTMWSFTCWREGEVERDPELRAGRALKELEGWPEELRNVVRSTPPSKIIEVYVGDSPLQWKTWSRQLGVSLMGDAAHSMLPTLAMGVTSALQDAVALTKCVDGPGTPLSEALKEYERARRLPTAALQVISRVVMVFIENVLCG